MPKNAWGRIVGRWALFIYSLDAFLHFPKSQGLRGKWTTGFKALHSSVRLAAVIIIRSSQLFFETTRAAFYGLLFSMGKKGKKQRWKSRGFSISHFFLYISLFRIRAGVWPTLLNIFLDASFHSKAKSDRRMSPNKCKWHQFDTYASRRVPYSV